MVIVFIVASLLRVFTFPFDPYKEIPNRSLYGLAFLMMKVNPFWSITVEGKDKYSGDRPTIFVANHQSFLDLPLAYLLPWKMKWVAKKELFKIPVMGWLIALTGHLSVERGKRSAVKRLENLVQPLRDHVPIMIFPEGTRSPNGELRRFKSGAFLLAKEHGFSVQPMVINGGHRALPSGSWKVGIRQKFHLSILDPVEPDNFESIDELKNHVHQLIESELHRLQERGSSTLLTE